MPNREGYQVAKKKGLVAKTIEIFSVSRKRKTEKETQDESPEDFLVHYVEKKPKKVYNNAGFSGLSNTLDRLADRPRK